MKRLGLIGNLNDALLSLYAKTINSEVRKELGGNHSAELRVCCADNAEFSTLLNEGDWSSITDQLVDHGRSLMLASADALVICGGALNPAANEVRRRLGIPLIDMRYAIEWKLRGHGHVRIVVIGARTPREELWWREGLEGIDVLLPSAEESAWLNDRIAAGLSGMEIDVGFKIHVRQIIARQRKLGARAVVLAAPMLGQWVKPDDVLIDCYDAAVVHAWAAALWGLDPGLRPAAPCVFAG